MIEFIKKRQTTHTTRMMKYMRYVFNDHFVLVLMFLLGGVGFYYSNFIQTLEVGTVWGRVAVILVLTVIVSFGGLATLLEEADVVFLLPKEKELPNYLRQTFKYSLIFPYIIEALITGFLMPLIVIGANGEFSHFFFYVLMIWSCKWLLMSLEVGWLYQGQRKHKQVQHFGVLFLVFIHSSLMLFVSPFFAILPLILSFVFVIRNGKKPLPTFDWEYAVKIEKQRMHRIYQFISLFTDVPEISSNVKRRKYFDGILTKINKKKENTYLYLFARSFLRGSEYSGLTLRLTLVGIALSIFIQQEFVVLGVGVLFIYLIGFQLIPLYEQFDYMLMTRLYPVAKLVKKKNMHSLLLMTLLSVAFLFGISAFITLDNLLFAFGIFVIYVIEVLLFIYGYLNARLKKMEDE